MKARFHPKVSVVIPTFNRRAMLAHAISSVLAQTERDLEVIVVDDASTDDTQAYCASIGDDRVTYVRNARNLGEGGSRNAGVEIARGRYVGFLDDDDLWMPHKLEQQLRCISKAPDVVWVYSGWQWVDLGSGRTTQKRIPDAQGQVDGLPRWAFNMVNDLIIQRQVALANPFDRTLGNYMPWDLVLRLSMTHRALYVPEILATCHTHRGVRKSDSKATSRAQDLDVLLRRYGGFMRSNSRGWARINLILGALCSRNLRDGRRARAPLIEVIRSRPSEWRGWAHLLLSTFSS